MNKTGLPTLQIRNSTAKFLIFHLEDKASGIEVFYQNETLWASQKAIYRSLSY